MKNEEQQENPSKTLDQILSEASIDELHQLRDLVLSVKKFSTDNRIRRTYTDPSIDGPYLGREIRKFGGNTFVNLFSRRRDGPPYEKVVTDVADKIKAKHRAGGSVEEVESAIITKLLGNAWNKMSEADRLDFIDNCGLSGKMWMSGVSVAALQAAFRAGGFTSYKILVIVVNAVVRQAIGVGLVPSGLSLATNATLTRTAASMVGPIGLVLTALITVWQVAGPSYKVTARSVAFIALLRRKQETPKCGKCKVIHLSSSKLCSECGATLPDS